jgi:multisite-specific tRNA:(cytosine-C5)-methyltransferase
MAKKNFRGRKGKSGRRDDDQSGWAEINKENEKWEMFYKQQDLMSEQEFAEFKEACKVPLPLTFRITGSRKYANEILDIFKERHLKYLKDLESEGEHLPQPRTLSFYPGELGWQLDVSKTIIRKNPQFAKLQRFLVIENEVGNISRQEAVSMIPPLVLDVKSHHKVLDMCAAPGSKTAQLIEALHADTSSPTGFVIANDSDFKRAHMLVHQIKRLNSPNMVVVNHDAQMFPKTYLNNQVVKFDRILCDVPCSGDGTMRKNVQIWKKWTIGDGLGLNKLQYKILQRGINLLAKGGRLVYSTCSLNPMENEAVVAEALRKNKDIKLVKTGLPGLKSSPGLKSWKVFRKDGTLVSKGGDEKYGDELFPPTDDDKMNLEDCIRVYPHLQNTGGFFITVFEKIDDTEDEQPVKKFKANETTTAATSLPKKEKLSTNAGDGNEPFNFLPSDHEELAKCWDFYGIDNKDPTVVDCCFVRNATGEPSRIIYLSNPTLKNFLTSNEEKLKIVHSGLKFFVSQRTDLVCKWRIQSENLPTIKAKLSDARVLNCSMSLFEKLLKEAFPRFDELEKSDPEFAAKVSKIPQGCAFVKISRGDDLEELVYPIWVGSKCINLMLSKKETFEVLYRVFNINTEANQEYKQGPTLEKSTAVIGERTEETTEEETEA